MIWHRKTGVPRKNVGHLESLMEGQATWVQKFEVSKRYAARKKNVDSKTSEELRSSQVTSDLMMEM